MNYKKLVPNDSFIGQYMEYMSELETPEAYDFWSAVWCIGTVCGRDVFVDRPRIPVYLNWYIILVAESGITRKGTNISLSHALVSGSVDTILSGKTTPRSLEVMLSKQTKDKGNAQAALCVPEMVTMFGKDSGSITLPALLTDLYDSPSKRNTASSIDTGETELKNVFISLLTASTPTWLGTAINPTVIEGGFTSRCIFVCETKRKRIVPWPKEQSGDTRERLLLCLQELEAKAKRVGGLSINAGGIRTFSNWYKNRTLNEDAFRSSFEAREDDHLLRLAGCLCINDGSFRINANHIKSAIRIIGAHKAAASDMFTERPKERETIGNGITRMRELLIKHGEPIAHTKLYVKVRWKYSSEDFKMIIKIMHECDLIDVFQKRNAKGTYYQATTKLMQPGSITEAIERLSL